MPLPRAEIDASAAQLDLRMTEGDTIRFNFLVPGVADWAGSSFLCQVRTDYDSIDVIATLSVTATASGADVIILISSAAVPALVAGSYVWDMQEVGGITRFGGLFFVERQVSQ